MSNYQDQLLSEVKRSRRTKQNYDSFALNDDRTQLQASFASLATADVSNVNTSAASQNEWEKAVHEYKKHFHNNDEYQKGVGVESSKSFLKGTTTCAHNRHKQRFWNVFLIRAFIIIIAIYTLYILIGPSIIVRYWKKSEWCPKSNAAFIGTKDYENPDYDTDPCDHIRIPLLMYLTIEEADHCRRMLISVALGAAIGFERRSSDRPAGIRTMSLVSLGACFFTISSNFAFKSSTMGWDSSRVSAAIPSGCGFLGAGLIWKGTINEKHEVHGLTTAAGIWLSAAIGVGCGGGLYFVSLYTAFLVTTLLRFGPKVVSTVKRNENSDESSSRNKQSVEAKESVQGMNVSLLNSQDLELFEIWKKERNTVDVQQKKETEESSRSLPEQSEQESPAYLLPT